MDEPLDEGVLVILQDGGHEAQAVDEPHGGTRQEVGQIEPIVVVVLENGLAQQLEQPPAREALHAGVHLAPEPRFAVVGSGRSPVIGVELLVDHELDEAEHLLVEHRSGLGLDHHVAERTPAGLGVLVLLHALVGLVAQAVLGLTPRSIHVFAYPSSPDNLSIQIARCAACAACRSLYRR
jgi:hypothetical protein